MERPVQFKSDDLELAGVLHVPDKRDAGRKLPAFLVLHGFMGSKDESHAEIQARMLATGAMPRCASTCAAAATAAARADTSCAWTGRGHSQRPDLACPGPEIDPDRIGVIGHSFGAAVSVYTAGVDQRVAAVISSCGWGHGERKFRGQHPTPEAWAKFTDILERGRAHKEKTGESLWVSRWDVVPIPEHLRLHLPKKAQIEVPADTAQSMYDFQAEEVVANIAPRPLMLLHIADDQVTPTEQSLRMFERAGKPTELFLITGVSHFPLAGDASYARDITKRWLDKFFPVNAEQGCGSKGELISRMGEVALHRRLFAQGLLMPDEQAAAEELHELDDAEPDRADLYDSGENPGGLGVARRRQH